MSNFRILKITIILSIIVLSVLPAFAQEPQPGAPTSSTPQMSSGRFFGNTMMFMIAGFVGYYYLVTRPMVQKEDSQNKFLSSLKKNDPVVISPGIFGRVVQIQDQEILVDVSNGVKLKVLPSAIQAPPITKEEKQN